MLINYVVYCIAFGVTIQNNVAESKRCGKGQFSCQDGSQCISSKLFCDSKIDCKDESDEVNNTFSDHNLTGRMCPVTSNGKSHSCIIHADEICNANKECVDDVDECLCDTPYFFDDDCFRCLTKHAYVIPSTEVCDGEMDCPDFTDECLCGSRRRPAICVTLIWGEREEWGQRGPYMTCNSTDIRHDVRIPYSSICNVQYDCKNGEDEVGCRNAQALTSREDESETTIMNDTRGFPMIKLMRSMPCVSATEEGNTSLEIASLCNGIRDCRDGVDEIGCFKESIRSSQSAQMQMPQRCWSPFGSTIVLRKYTWCDGEAECGDVINEECVCEKNASFCKFLKPGKYGLPWCNAAGPSGDSITIVTSEDICNGDNLCRDYEDERGCEGRFFCSDDDVDNIPVDRKCDGRDDCPFGEDERNCSYFYCNDTGKLKYLSQNSVCDGVPDCFSSRDECQPECIDSAFSDENEMITNKAILAFVWILSIIAMVGCISVIAMACYDLLQCKARQRNNKQREIYKRMIISLAVSDFLVGNFTFAICIKAAQMDENYCRLDREWRGSSTCAGLGAILLIGSEQSVLTMVLIALLRLNSIIRPFAEPKVRQVTIVMVISWIISLLLGIIPLLPINEDYFVSSIIFSENRIIKTIYHNETEYMIEWLRQMHNDTALGSSYGSTDWSKVKKLVAELNPNITVKYEFGYYSSHTVCLPTLFPDRSEDKAWAYSAMLLTINSVAFVFMMVAYIALYRQTATSESAPSVQEQRKEENAKLQRKLTRILVTDFLCWMPICIMGFLQLSGVKIPNDAYLPAGLLVIPINSALNPLLYSDLPGIILKKCAHVQRLVSSLESRPTGSQAQDVTAA